MANQSKISNSVMGLLITLQQKPKTKLIGITIFALIFLLLKFKPKKRQSVNIKRSQGKKNVGHADKQFFINLKQLLKIVIPRFLCKENFTIFSLSLFLVLRTFLSIFIAEVNGKIVKSMIDVKFNSFIKNILKLCLMAVPGSFMNSYLEFLRQKLTIQVRTRIINHFMNKLTQNKIFYKLGNVDARINNVDQIITQDIDKWSNTLTTLYNNITKPILDIMLFARKLSQILGWQGPTFIVLWYVFAVIIIRLISPSFGKLVAQEQKLEGEYREAHSIIVSHSEEIAFYQGHNWEKLRLIKKFYELIKHQSLIMYKKLFMGSFDSMLIKYGAAMGGYSVVGIPVFSKGSQQYLKSVNNDQAQITMDYVRNSSLLISLAKAIGRLIISYKDISQLAGYTHIVSELNNTISDLSQGNYSQDLNSNKKFDLGIQNTTENQDIEFFDVTIQTPKGDVLIKQSGVNVLVQGPNASGKSSLFRMLSGLWPLQDGQINQPMGNQQNGGIFYVPQKCYLPLGTLRDQVIYPDTVQTMKQKQITDQDLVQIMTYAHLDYIIQREDGFDAINDWNDVLSGGEKQRINVARLFYHKPQMAVLDDCTSAVSVDIEKKLFEHIKKLNTTFFYYNYSIITVSHRQNLSDFHNWILQIDVQGSYEWIEI